MSVPSRRPLLALSPSSLWRSKVGCFWTWVVVRAWLSLDSCVLWPCGISVGGSCTQIVCNCIYLTFLLIKLGEIQIRVEL